MDIKSVHKQICNLITGNKIADALLLIDRLADEVADIQLKEESDNQKETFNYLLEYTIKGVEDPDRLKIYKDIQRKLLNIADKLKSKYLDKFLNANKLSVQRKILQDQIKYQNVSIPSEIHKLLTIDKTPEEPERKLLISKLFFLIWLNDDLTEEDFKALQKTAFSKKLFVHEMSVIVSAITLSLLRYFDKIKFRLLFGFYDADLQEVWNRALIGLVLSFYYYDKRIALYDDLLKYLKTIKQDENIKTYTEQIIFQIIRSKETENISKKLQDEIIPEMQKFRPKIEDKLNLDDILSDGLIEDSNPDWEELFDDAPELLDKMADFSKLQLEGSDVFMSAFSQLKNFPFFNDIANWFVPFYSENQYIKQIFSDFGDDFDSESFIKGLERSPFMCNSDKYSFCLNIGMMPVAQRNMITELFKQESKQTLEISKEDKLLDKTKEEKQIFTQYLQDLYRFFKLHPLKNEIEDIFDTELDLHNTIFYKILIDDDEVTEKIAEMNFKKGFYNDALDIFEKLKFDNFNKEAKKYEKIGFCYQKIKKWDKALENYKKAEIIKKPSFWLTKKIAFCYRKLHRYDEALKYYLSAEKEDSENLHIQANIGHCYLETNDFENALKKYFKVEYYDPDNKTVMRPLAWCSFMVGKLDTAKSYYKKLLQENPTAYDYINYGHLLFSLGQKLNAAELYVKAVELSDIRTFENSISDDKEVLKKFNISSNDIDLIVDYVKIKTL